MFSHAFAYLRGRSQQLLQFSPFQLPQRPEGDSQTGTHRIHTEQFYATLQLRCHVNTCALSGKSCFAFLALFRPSSHRTREQICEKNPCLHLVKTIGNGVFACHVLMSCVNRP